MDNLSNNIIEIELSRYRLLHCNAESKTKPSPNTGGSIEITSEISPPSSPAILNKDDFFVIRIHIGIIGRSKDSQDIAFSASCDFEGTYRLINCKESGVSTRNNFDFWLLAINQLHPLLSQFITDIVSKMGFKNINVPLIIPGRYKPKQNTVKKPPRKKTLPVKAR